MFANEFNETFLEASNELNERRKQRKRAELLHQETLELGEPPSLNKEGRKTGKGCRNETSANQRYDVGED